jgi:hypothetical protein
LDTSAATHSAPMPQTPGPPMEIVTYNMTSNQGSLKASISFRNGSLTQIYLSDYVGSPSLNQSEVGTLDMAMGFMQRYTTYTGNQLYESLSSMLNGITGNENETELTANARLQVAVFGGEQDLTWTYTDSNGVPALAKDVILTFNNGRLESFDDNWQLYQVSSAPNLSSQDAIAIATQAAQNYSYTVSTINGANVTVSGFKVASIGNVTLNYINYYEQTPEISVRGGNPFVLYPSWNVELGFDKVYPGSITGAIVKIWADTGTVSSFSPMTFPNQAPAPNDTTAQVNTNQASIPAIILPIAIVLPIISLITLSSAAVYLQSSGTKINRSKRIWRINFSAKKIVALSLCAIAIGAVVVLPTGRASSQTSEIYIQKEPSGYSGNYYSSIDSTDEYYADAAANYMNTLYTGDGVVTNEYYGFSNSEVISNIINDETNYATVWVFAYGNGYIPAFYDSDNPPNSIYSFPAYGSPNIYSETAGYTAHHFIWQWTCTLADNTNFAEAWTNYGITSTDGFNNPDYSGYAYIGFQGEAPFVGAETQAYELYTPSLYMWIEWVYYYAACGYDLHDALNRASITYFDASYLDGPLPYGSLYGMNTWWPGFSNPNQYPVAGWYAGGMMVYGDSTIHIF